jgi:hypothetical protein
MALTRKMLKAMGIEDDKIDQIIEAHTEVTDALKEQVQTATAKASKFDAVEKELNSLKEKGGDWQEKYEKEHKDFEEYKSSIESEKALTAKKTAYKALLKEASIDERRFDAILRLANLDEINLNKDGGISNKDKLLETVKTEWADYVVKTDTKGANPANPPANNGGTTVTKESIMKIKDPTERQKAIAENIELFQK